MGTKLGRADLCRADLRGANLRRADLSRAQLYGAQLGGADLRRADLRGAQLRDAQLLWADLSEANLSEADLSWADLGKADFRLTDLNEADLSRAQLYGADLSKADLRRAQLIWADLSEADLSEADFRGANFHGADLRGADLRGADLRGADLRGAQFYRAKLGGAKLGGADLSGTDLRRANLRWANLRWANLRWANLRWANLRWAKLPIEETFNIKVFDPTIDPSDLAELRNVIANYAEAAGYTEPEILSEKHGSFFSKIRYKIAKILTPETVEEATREGEDFYRRGKENLKAQLERTGVEATQKLSTATAELLKAVENFDNIILTLGKLIVVKYTAPNGQTKTIVRTVSTEIQNKLESTPHILDDPKTLLGFLQEKTTANQDVPLSVIPEERQIG